jgi:hypothetical protein
MLGPRGQKSARISLLLEIVEYGVGKQTAISNISSMNSTETRSIKFTLFQLFVVTLRGKGGVFSYALIGKLF